MDKARLWSKADMQTLEGCWEWQGKLDAHGYGRHTQDGKSCYAHRLAYEAMRGPIPPGLVIDHLCRNRACVNPDHLEPVTDQVNRERGRFALGNTAGHERKIAALRRVAELYPAFRG